LGLTAEAPIAYAHRVDALLPALCRAAQVNRGGHACGMGGGAVTGHGTGGLSSRPTTKSPKPVLPRGTLVPAG
jgi:hypothetical protein